jgi:hypothetical protein
MSVEIITKEDLQQFKSELLNDLLRIIQPHQPRTRQWLKSNEVRKLLKISPGTLQNLRINGTLRYSRVGSICYYKQEDIDRLLENGGKEDQRNSPLPGRLMKSI